MNDAPGVDLHEGEGDEASKANIVPIAIGGRVYSECAISSRTDKKKATMVQYRRYFSTAKLKNVISELIRAGDPTLNSAAARLRMSPRSLQRQLETQELTYSDIVDEVRYEIARSLLANTGLDVAEIGATLGYRDPSSFSRAFMRWSGVSPRQYRLSVRNSEEATG